MDNNLVNQVIFLTNLSNLMKKWGIRETQWFIEDGFFLTPYLHDFYNLNSGIHFHIKINKKAIPWQIDSYKQILPPLNSQYLNDYMQFLEKNCELMIDTKEEENFQKLFNECEAITVNKGIEIYQTKLLNRLHKMLLRFTEVPDLNPFRYHELIDKAYRYAQKYKNQQIIDLLEQVNTERLKKEIKGLAISNKTISGYVKLLLPGHKAKTMTDDQILVTEKTSPKLLPLIIKAKGIVAEIGGLTSHAAITCREFNLPGIIEVENALYLFRDGDYIEMKSDGLIKIIKQNVPEYKL